MIYSSWVGLRYLRVGRVEERKSGVGLKLRNHVKYEWRFVNTLSG